MDKPFVSILYALLESLNIVTISMKFVYHVGIHEMNYMLSKVHHSQYFPLL